jgi:hypothetical protein
LRLTVSLPSGLLPVSLREYKAAKADEQTTVECATCARVLPPAVFAKLKGTKFRHKTCNHCRALRFESYPSTIRKRGYVTRARSRPCIDCGDTFAPECTHLVHTRDASKFNVTTAWRWHSEDDVTDEIKKCDTVCANCMRIRRAKRADAKAKELHDLAEVQRAAHKIPGPPQMP